MKLQGFHFGNDFYYYQKKTHFDLSEQNQKIFRLPKKKEFFGPN